MGLFPAFLDERQEKTFSPFSATAGLSQNSTRKEVVKLVLPKKEPLPPESLRPPFPRLSPAPLPIFAPPAGMMEFETTR